MEVPRHEKRHDLKSYHGNEVMSEQDVARPHIVVDDRAATAFLMQETKAFRCSDRNRVPLMPLQSVCCLICNLEFRKNIKLSDRIDVTAGRISDFTEQMPLERLVADEFVDEDVEVLLAAIPKEHHDVLVPREAQDVYLGIELVEPLRARFLPHLRGYQLPVLELTLVHKPIPTFPEKVLLREVIRRDLYLIEAESH